MLGEMGVRERGVIVDVWTTGVGIVSEFCELNSSGAFTSVTGWKGVRVGG